MGTVVSFDQQILVIHAKASLGMGEVCVEGSLTVGVFPNRGLAEAFVEDVKGALEEQREPTMAEKRAETGSEPIPELAALFERPYNDVSYVAHTIAELSPVHGVAKLPRITADNCLPQDFAKQIPRKLLELLEDHVR